MIMAKSNTVDTAGALPDWKEDGTVRDLNAKRQAVQAEIAAVEAELAGRKRHEVEAPNRLIQIWERVFSGQAPEVEAQRFAAEGPARTQAIAQAEGRLLSLRSQLLALDGAISAVERSAQHAAAKALEASYKAEAAVLLKAYEGVAASSARMHRIYQHALGQFPLIAVYGAPKPYAKDIKHAAGLEPLYDSDSVRAQRGTAGHLPAAPWDRATFGGRFKQVWDGLRQYLGLEPDHGDLSPEGAEALRLHQAQGRVEREKREAALRQAVKVAEERGEILPPYLRAS
jgi:hypothetical protein